MAQLNIGTTTFPKTVEVGDAVNPHDGISYYLNQPFQSYIPSTTGVVPTRGDNYEGSGPTDRTATQGGCLTHKQQNNTGSFKILNTTSTGRYIFAKEINALRHSMRSVSNFWNKSGNGQIYTSVLSNTSKASRSVISQTEWNDVRNKIMQFRGRSDIASIDSIDTVSTSTVITSEFHNDLVQAYHLIINSCRCHSDCGCNYVCVCNYNCECNYSDIRLKENIEKLDGSVVDKLLNINTYKYYYNDSIPDKTLQYGVIAQELLDDGLYDLVIQKEEYLAVDYSKFTPMLIKTVQYQNNRLNEQQLLIDQLMDRLDTLEGKYNGK
ncbi:MAG: tail fiber domain-containing protein [Sphaerochaeta sp.]